MARKSNGEPKIFAYEEFMAKARKEGRVRNEELSMKVLKPDLSLQARVNHINVDHVRGLHDILKGGQQLAPIIVFEIEELKGKTVVKTFKIADGFHRHEVYKREGLPGIPCVVVTGTLQEAIEYAASANQALSLPRTREDSRKAVLLLLDNGWFNRAATVIATQVGVTSQTVDRIRLNYCTSKGISPPELRIDSNGRERRLRRSVSGPCVLRKSTYGKYDDGRYVTYDGSRTVNLGRDKKEAESRLAAINAKRASKASVLETRPIELQKACASRGVGVATASTWRENTLRFVGGYHLPGVAVATWKDGSSADFLRAVGGVVLIAAHYDLPRKIVVKEQADHAFGSLVEVAKSIGVEFMTLDEFVAAVKADEKAAVPATATASA